MRSKSFLLISIVCFILSGCDVMKQVGGAYNMTQCKYSYESISKLNLAGMDLSKGLSLSNIPAITSILTGNTSSVPLNFTLNLDVNNPGQTAALLNGLQYILSIDDVQFTTGSLNQSLNVPSGGNQILPLAIGVDLGTLLRGDSKDVVVNVVKNFLGMSNTKSNVSFQIKPTFMIGNVPITSPVYIPVNFAFGGGK